MKTQGWTVKHLSNLIQTHSVTGLADAQAQLELELELELQRKLASMPSPK